MGEAADDAYEAEFWQMEREMSLRRSHVTQGCGDMAAVRRDSEGLLYCVRCGWTTDD
jgi:ribosomal protein L37AE/L43A